MTHKVSLTLRARYMVYGALYRLRKNIAVSHDERFLSLYEDVTKSGRLTMNLPELYNIYRLLRSVASIPGDVAELGVFRGASAKVIAEVKGKKSLYLFDTFAGLPEIDQANDLTAKSTAFTHGSRESLALNKGKFSAEFEDVRHYLSAYENVQFRVGIFPNTVTDLEDRRFSFVHLDADIYSSTVAGLEFFYPRLSPGGILISHDYGTVSCPGVKKAFDEFMKNRPELLIELWDTQVMLVKAGQ